MLPHARVNELVIRELAEETLVYDLKRHKAHCLNRVAALVWRHCDGRTTPTELVKLLHDQLKVPVDERLVSLALDQLGRAHLLQERLPPSARPSRFSRRDFARKLGIAVAVVPVVMTILAPSVAMAKSCAPSGGACNGNPDCCTGRCVNRKCN